MENVLWGQQGVKTRQEKNSFHSEKNLKERVVSPHTHY